MSEATASAARKFADGAGEGESSSESAAGGSEGEGDGDASGAGDGEGDPEDFVEGGGAGGELLSGEDAGDFVGGDEIFPSGAPTSGAGDGEDFGRSAEKAECRVRKTTAKVANRLHCAAITASAT